MATSQSPVVQPADAGAPIVAAQVAAEAALLTSLSLTEVEIEAGLVALESDLSYVLEGSGKVWLKDKPDVPLKAGDVYKVPLEQIHTAVTEKEGLKALVFRVHKKGEPERVPAKE